MTPLDAVRCPPHGAERGGGVSEAGTPWHCSPHRRGPAQAGSPAPLGYCLQGLKHSPLPSTLSSRMFYEAYDYTCFIFKELSKDAVRERHTAQIQQNVDV